MHHIDRGTGWDEIWEAMEVLRAQGKILYVGSSNFAGWHIAKAQEAAARRNFMGLVSEQSHLQPDRDAADRARGAAGGQDYGLGVIPWSPLPGRPARRRRAQGARRQPALRRHAPPRRSRPEAPQLEAYEDLCAEVGEEPGTVGLAWLLTRPAVTGPIVGPRTPEQLESALRAVDVTLDDKVLARLDELFPGHKTAPEDYAW